MTAAGRRLWVSVLLALVVAWTGSCAPKVFPPGPDLATPAITEGGLLARDGVVMPLKTWTLNNNPPKAVILALHGFNDYSAFFDQPGAYFAERGIVSYAFDQRGFGRTSNRGAWAGIDAYIKDLGAAVTALREHHPGIPLYLLGESMGGAVIMTAMTSANAPHADGVILAAPAIWGRDTMPWYQRAALFIGVHTLPTATVTGQSLKIKPSDNIEMLRALGRDPLVIKKTRIDTIYGLANLMDRALEASPAFKAKALILYGQKDEVIPGGPTRLMLSRLPVDIPGQRIALYPDGYHMLLRDLQAETVLADIAAWIEDGAGPLPSGADIYARNLLAKK